MEVKDKVREDDGERQELVLTITASAEEVDAAADKFFKEVAKRDIPGFRKGKAPRTVLEQTVGGHVNAMGGVAEQLINDLAFKAIDGADVIFVGEPEFNVDAQLETGKPFSFTVSGQVAPVMTLTSYEPVSIEMPPEEATEAEIDEQLRQLQDYYHSFEDIEDPDHEAAMGDYVQAVVTVTNNGRLLPSMNQTNRMIGLGKGSMPEGFDAQLVGAKAGEVREFDFEAKDDEGNAAFGDGNLHAVVEVKGFRREVLPPIDDALAVKVGCTDVSDMRDQMRRAINMQKGKDLPKLMVDRVVDAALERLDGEVPSYYVDFIRQDVGRELMHSLEKKGTNLQDFLLHNQLDSDDFKAQVSGEAQRRAAIDCMLEAVFAHEGMEVTDEDIDRMFEGGTAQDQTREAWEKANRMSDIRKMCRQQKATRWLVDNAQVTVVDASDEAAGK
ncbi:MAG TPA: trigger factor [Candidatus Aphodovivens avistercoris]|nr:trigger factor [Candidatus Aphodovivens avistercoris]